MRLIILSLRQLAFRFFAMMAFTRFKKFKTYVEKAYLKKSQKNNLRFNFELYFYWYNKCIANHFTRTLRRQLENLHKTSSISLMLNVAAPVALVVLSAIMPHSIIQTSEPFNNAVSLVPLGLMFINVFFEILHTDGNFLSFFLLVHRPQLLSQSSYPHFPCAAGNLLAISRRAAFFIYSILESVQRNKQKTKARSATDRNYLKDL